MNRTWKISLSFVGLLALITLTGLYRSYVDKTTNVVGFDKVATSQRRRTR